MAVGKEIRTKIGSIKNTQKITSAMEMVAASKMRKAQDRMEATKPYAERIRGVIGHLAMGHTEYKHPYIIEREVKRVGFIESKVLLSEFFCKISIIISAEIAPSVSPRC